MQTRRILLAALFAAAGVADAASPRAVFAQPDSRLATSSRPATDSRPAASAPAVVKKAPIPAQAELQKALKDIQEVYKVEYADRQIDAKGFLAGRLMTQADEYTQADATRMMLYREAARASASVGNIASAMHAADQIDAVFQSDADAFRVEALDLAANLPGIETQQLLAEAYVEIADGRVEQENFPLATKLLTKAMTAARKAQHQDLAASIQKRMATVAFLQIELPKILEARKVLEGAPKDPVAAGTVGRFAALGKGDWVEGLPMLAKGDQKLLADLATQELSLRNDPLDPPKVVALADGWWDLAETLQPAQQYTVQQHAGSLYESVVQQLEGFPKKKAEQRIAQTVVVSKPKYNPAQLPRILVTTNWVFKPTRNGQRPMTFAPSGQITTGANNREAVARIVGEKLELYGKDRQLKRRMVYDSARGYFKVDSQNGDDPKDLSGVLLPVVPRQLPRASLRDREAYRALLKTEWEATWEKNSRRFVIDGEGSITGKNEERCIRVINGRLEILHETGCVMWRFDYDPKRKAWVSDPREFPDTLGAVRERHGMTLKQVESAAR